MDTNIANTFNASVAAKNTIKLQTAVSPATKELLRLESVRRNVSMGMLLDEFVDKFFSVFVAEKTS